MQIGGIMINKKALYSDRIRKITGSFAFAEHRFLRDGFWTDLDHHQLLLYLFLIIVADRNGLSYYSYDKICTLLRISGDEYIFARDGLIKKDLIAFDGYLFQVLSLPEKPVPDPCEPLRNLKETQKHDPATIRRLIDQCFGRKKHG